MSGLTYRFLYTRHIVECRRGCRPSHAGATCKRGKVAFALWQREAHQSDACNDGRHLHCNRLYVSDECRCECHPDAPTVQP